MDGVERPPGLPAVLVRLADAGATGCLHVRGSGTSRVHLRAGRLLSVALAADLPARPLGARLLAAGLVTAAALAEAQEAQRTELQGWRLGELLVHLGSADPLDLAPHVRDQLVDDLRTLLAAPYTTARFRPGDRVRGDLADPLDLRPLLAGLGHDLPVDEPVVVPDPVVVLEPVQVPEPVVVLEPVQVPEPVVVLEPVEVPEPLEAEPAAPSYAELAAANTRDFADAFAASSAAPPAEVPPEPPGPVAEPDPVVGPAAAEQRDAGWDRSDTDTAALLRELSSLGGAEPSAPAPPARPVAPATTPSSIAAQRKRKGLFGRV